VGAGAFGQGLGKFGFMKQIFLGYRALLGASADVFSKNIPEIKISISGFSLSKML